MREATDGSRSGQYTIGWHEGPRDTLRPLFELAEDEGTTVLFVSHDRTIQSLFSRAVSLGDIQKGGA